MNVGYLEPLWYRNLLGFWRVTTLFFLSKNQRAPNMTHNIRNKFGGNVFLRATSRYSMYPFLLIGKRFLLKNTL